MTKPTPTTNGIDGLLDPLAKYASCMEEAKKRILVVNGFFTGKCHAMYVQTTVESIYLQIRKILELIALASMCANQSEYQKHRNNFRRDWNGERILKTLEKANPRFYPQPTKQIIDQGTGKVVSTEDVTSGFLTKSDYMTLYNICGEILHSDNPFDQRHDTQSFLDRVPGWMNKIIRLLEHHQIQLIDDDLQIWVVMKAKKDEKVHLSVMEKIGEVDPGNWTGS